MRMFEMPIVALSEMTMNESIATDCCYKIVEEGLVTTKVILNGGTIGKLTTYGLVSAARSYFGSTPAPSYHAKVTIRNTGDTSTTTTYTVLGSSTNESGTIIAYIDNDSVGRISSDQYVNYYNTSGLCDHESSSCPFVTRNDATDQHMKSQVPHLFGGANWDQPHAAQQYNS